MLQDEDKISTVLEGPVGQNNLLQMNLISLSAGWEILLTVTKSSIYIWASDSVLVEKELLDFHMC